MKVCKFGGSSLADAVQVGKVCDIVLADADRRIVVVSAPGKRDSDDIKVTDMLIACAESRLAGNSAEDELKAVVDRFASIQRDLGLPESITEEIGSSIKAIAEGDHSEAGKFMDAMKAAGENNCAKLVAAEFRRRGVEARYLDPRDAGLLLSNEFGNAQLLPDSNENLAKAFDGYEHITVFPGFFGYTSAGDIATFPRGGSDITGSIIAAAVHADVYENFTDVDSVFAVDPGIVPDVKPIIELTYHEMRELAYAGFGVLHDEAIVPAVHAGVPICIKNTNKPEAPGTRIVLEREHEMGRVLGVASSDGFCALNISKYLMNREVGFGRRLLQIIEEESLSYEHMPSGIDNMSVILREDGLTPEVEEHVIQRIKTELEVDELGIERGLAIVMLVGEGMHYAVGVAAKATDAFANAEVNIEMINQGSSEISMMFGVKAVDRKKAVTSLYNAFFKS